MRSVVLNDASIRHVAGSRTSKVSHSLEIEALDDHQTPSEYSNAATGSAKSRAKGHVRGCRRTTPLALLRWSSVPGRGEAARDQFQVCFGCSHNAASRSIGIDIEAGAV